VKQVSNSCRPKLLSFLLSSTARARLLLRRALLPFRQDIDDSYYVIHYKATLVGFLIFIIVALLLIYLARTG
jgi:hypothetical protein